MKSPSSPVLSKHSHRRCKHSIWGQVWTSVDAIPSNPASGISNIASALAAKKMCSIPLRDLETPVSVTYRFSDYQTCSSQNENSTSPPFSTVLHPTNFWQLIRKIIYFPRKEWRDARRGLVWSGSQLVFSLRPPEEWTDYHRLSGRTSVSNPLRSGLWMQIKLSFLSNTLWRKPIPKAAVWCSRTVRLNAAKWLN